jgi:hypothetical protein
MFTKSARACLYDCPDKEKKAGASAPAFDCVIADRLESAASASATVAGLELEGRALHLFELRRLVSGENFRQLFVHGLSVFGLSCLILFPRQLLVLHLSAKSRVGFLLLGLKILDLCRLIRRKAKGLLNSFLRKGIESLSLEKELSKSLHLRLIEDRSEILVLLSNHVGSGLGSSSRVRLTAAAVTAAAITATAEIAATAAWAGLLLKLGELGLLVVGDRNLFLDIGAHREAHFRVETSAALAATALPAATTAALGCRKCNARDQGD